MMRDKIYGAGPSNECSKAKSHNCAIGRLGLQLHRHSSVLQVVAIFYRPEGVEYCVEKNCSACLCYHVGSDCSENKPVVLQTVTDRYSNYMYQFKIRLRGHTV